MKVVAIDYGAKRIGIAVGDTELKIAVPSHIVKNREGALEEIADLIKTKGAKRVIVGLPLTPSGKEGQRAKEVRRFVEDLKDKLKDIEIILWDERYTTQEAISRVGTKASKKEHVDHISAQIILEEYLLSL